MGGGNRYALLKFDADKDGTLSAEELRTGMLGDLKTYDTNGDGTLSLDEFQGLFVAHTHHMVRGFQMLDEDGDGKVTGSNDHRGRCHAGPGPGTAGARVPGLGPVARTVPDQAIA